MATSTTDPTICTCPSLFCTNVCMYKSLNKNCATFLIKKKRKSICILFYLVLNYICQLFFFFYNKKAIMIRYLFVNIIQCIVRFLGGWGKGRRVNTVSMLSVFWF